MNWTVLKLMKYTVMSSLMAHNSPINIRAEHGIYVTLATRFNGRKGFVWG